MIRLREIGWAVVVLILVATLFWVETDASRRRIARAARQGEREASVRLLGTADLFLSSSSRWIRHPSLSEPGAAFQESPAGLDVDPAGVTLFGDASVWKDDVRIYQIDGIAVSLTQQ